jgi:phage-related protein
VVRLALIKNQWGQTRLIAFTLRSRAMGDGLFELRCKGEEGIGRAFYCAMRGRQIVILNSFIKKTQETPDRELKTARKRLKEIKHDN